MKFRKKELIDLIIVFIISLIFSWILLQTELWYRNILPLIMTFITLIMIIKSYNSYILLDNEWISEVKFKLFKWKQTIFRYKYDEIKDIKIWKNWSYWTYLSTRWKGNMLNPSSQKIRISLKSWEDLRIGKIFHIKKFMNLLNENKTNCCRQSYSKIDSYSLYSIRKSIKEYYKAKKLWPWDEIFRLSSSFKILIINLCVSLPIAIIYEYLDYQFDFIVKDSLFYEYPLIKILFVYTIIFIVLSIPDLLTLQNFIKLTTDSIIIAQNGKISKFRYLVQDRKILKFKYSDVEEIEIVKVENDDFWIYIKLKNQQLKEAFYWLKDWNAFINALKMKWINAHFVSDDKMITSLKDEDLY